MKDKVYFNIHTGQFNYEQKQKEDKVFVDKSELLKWAKKKFSLAQKTMKGADRDWNRAYENGLMTAYYELTNKLESM